MKLIHILILGSAILLPRTTVAESISIGQATGTPGATVTVPVTLSSASRSLAAANLRIEFDPSVLEQPVVEAGTLLTARHILDSYSPSPGALNIVIYPPGQILAFSAQSGTLCNLTFKVRVAAHAGVVSPIVFAHTDTGSPTTPPSGVSDVSGVSIAHSRIEGSVSVISPPSSVTDKWNLYSQMNVEKGPLARAQSGIKRRMSSAVIGEKRF